MEARAPRASDRGHLEPYEGPPAHDESAAANLRLPRRINRGDDGGT